MNKINFLKNFAIILVLGYTFVFFGGWMLFDFSNSTFLTTASCSFVIAVIVSTFDSQEERIEKLEKKVKELEEKSNSSL